jgi:parallel beta-helix repeat protein
MNKNTAFPILIVILLVFSLACNFTSYAQPSDTSTIPTQQPDLDSKPVVPLEEPSPIVEVTPTQELPPTATPKTPRTVRVAADGSGDYPNLQAAIDDLVEGSTIMLDAGDYIIDETVQINKSLTIQGAGMDQTNLRNGQRDGVFLFAGPGKLDLKGITFLYTGIVSGQAAGIENGEFHIDDCRFTSTEKVELEEGRNGLFVVGTSNGTIVNSRFDHNQRHGLSVSDQSNVVVEFSEFDHNDSYGVRYFEQSQGTVSNCTASNNESGFGATEQAEVLFENNATTANLYFGFSITGQAVAEVISNKIYGNQLSGIKVDENAKTSLVENEIYENVENGVFVIGSGLLYASQNVIYSNQYHGFSLAEQSVVTIVNNEINNHVYNAISFYDSSTGEVSGNICAGNLDGIVKYGDQTPTIGENDCQ